MPHHRPRRFLCLITLLLAAHLTSAGQIPFGVATPIDDGWSFALQDNAAARQPQFDDHAWQRVDVPHDWSIRGRMRPDLASCTGYLPGGVGWYRRKLIIPTRPGGEKVYVYFEGVYNRSAVYLNGHLLGRRPNGYVSFIYDATPYVRFDQANILAVRVDHSRSADSRWYTGSGIYRHVFLLRAGAVHLAPWGVFARNDRVDHPRDRLDVDAEIQNESASDVPLTVRHDLLAADGLVVASAVAEVTVRAQSSATSRASLELRAPHLWSLRDPYLYRLRTTIAEGTRELDRTTFPTGIRRFTFDADAGFSLNSEPVKMKGVCLHDDAGVLGAAVPTVVWRQRLQTLRSLGCNAVRTSHNPQSPDFYDLCDELGLLVLDEAFDEWEYPKRKWLRGWNVGEPGFEGSSDFFAEWSERDLTDMVRRDRNHPCVFAWSIGNEVDYPNDPYSHPVLDGTRINQPMYGGYKPDHPNAGRLGAIARRLVAAVKRQDLTRPVTAALAGVVMSNETEYPAALDLTGYNYTEDRYAMDHARYPHRIIFGSENGHSWKAWRAVQDNRYIFGQFLWTGVDYLGEAGPWPSRGSGAGLLDLTGAIKPRGHFRAALWSDHPVAYLGTEPAPRQDGRSIDAWPVWNYAPGTAVQVLCYTNAPHARLFLNGRHVGAEQAQDHETGVITWDVPFEAGKLEVVGIDDAGAEICRARLRSAGAPAAIVLSTDQPVLPRDHGVAIVAAQIVDVHGTPVMGAQHQVTCAVEGPAHLLGLEAGDLRDVSDATDAVRAAHHGRVVAYVQAIGAPGPVQVLFRAAGLPDARQTLILQ